MNNSDLYARDVLCHWGVLGMKWGQRRYQNKDGSLTPEGREHYGVGSERKQTNKNTEDVKNIISKYQYNEDCSDEIFKKLGADTSVLKKCDEEIKKQIKEQKEITKLTDDLFSGLENDDSVKKQYEAASETAAYMDAFSSDPSKFDCDTLGWTCFLGVYEDGQQSKINAYSMYTAEQGMEDEVKDLTIRAEKSYDDCEKVCTDLISDALKEVGLKEANGRSVEGTASWIYQHKKNSMEDFEDHWGRYRLQESEPLSPHEKELTKKSKEWINHLDKNPNTWWVLSEAMENLGYDTVPVDDLSQSDWDKINKYCRENRRW